MGQPQIAILGAGLSGLTCARRLTDAGFSVTLFEQQSDVAGRMSTKKILLEGQNRFWQFDHGAQYFTARSPEFRQQVAEWIRRGVVAEWSGPFITLSHGIPGNDPGTGDPRYVGTPGMIS